MLPTILIASIINSALAWKSPPVLFIDEFSSVHSLNKIVIHLPDNMSNHWVEWHSNLQIIQRESGMKQTSFIYQDQNNDYMINDKELQVYVPNDKELDASLNLFIQIYSGRQRDDHEFWLFDVSSWKTLEDIVALMKLMPLDLDDDLYFYSFEEKEDISIWEFYEIHQSRPRKIFEYGRWNKVSGLLLVPETKWVRRKDLEGINLKITTLKEPPYITKLIPIIGGGDEYEFEGLIADFFHNLQNTLNFTCTITQPPDGAWGSLQSGGSWNGMVGELYNKRADIGTI